MLPDVPHEAGAAFLWLIDNSLRYPTTLAGLCRPASLDPTRLSAHAAIVGVAFVSEGNLFAHP
jgi:hypothetical protein